MAVFVNGDAEKAAGLVARLDKLVKETPNLKAFVVFQASAQVRPTLERIAKEKEIQVPLTIPAGALDEVQKLFKLDPKAQNTFLVYRGKKVLLNAVDVTEKDFGKIEEAAKKAAAD